MKEVPERDSDYGFRGRGIVLRTLNSTLLCKKGDETSTLRIRLEFLCTIQASENTYLHTQSACSPLSAAEPLSLSFRFRRISYTEACCLKCVERFLDPENHSPSLFPALLPWKSSQ